MRQGTPEISLQEIGSQIVVHNYGHGGSGWTLVPGASAYVIDLSEEKLKTESVKDKPTVTVIGAGALGLFTALNLVQRGYDVTVVAAAFDNLTSHNMDNALELQGRIDQIGIDAYKLYQSIAWGTHPLLKTGVVICPTYFETRPESGLEPYVDKVMHPSKDVILDFGNGTERRIVAYDDGIFMDTAGLMTSLRQALEGKVKFVQKKFKRFDDIETSVIINCAGLDARELIRDTKMVSVQGHLVMLKDQKPADLNYMILIYLPDDVTSTGKKIKGQRNFMAFHLEKTLKQQQKVDVRKQIRCRKKEHLTVL